MSLMERKSKRLLKKDHSQTIKKKNRKSTFNLIIVMTFLMQLILPVGLQGNAMSEADGAVEAVTVHAQEAEDPEKAEKDQQAEEAEKQALAEEEAARKAEEEEARKAEEEAARKAEEEAARKAEEEALKKAEEEAAKQAEEEAAKKAEEEAAKQAEEEAAKKAEEEAAKQAEEEARKDAENDKKKVVESEELEEDGEEFFSEEPGTIVIPAMAAMKLSNAFPDTIEVDKTAKRTLDEDGNKIGCRTFEVTLDITGTPPAKPIDVVLVIDTSGSMNTGGRMQATKNAAKSFANVVLGDGNPNNNRISIVNYATNANHRLPWSNQLGTVNGSLDNLTANGFTNIHQGFIYAGNRITGTGVSGGGAKPEATKVIVMMSDGGANRYMVGNTTMSSTTYPTSHTNATIAAYQQGQALQSIANIFTIGLFTGMPVGEKNIATQTLQWSAPAGQFYDAPTPDDLEEIYTSIASVLNYSAKDAVVKDKIGDNFDLVESSLPAGATYDPTTREITWYPGSVPGTIVESAQLKYIVRAKSTFAGGMANTNQYAKLNYTDVNGNTDLSKNFPVPKVNVPTLIEVSLTDATINLGDSISLGSGAVAGGENYMSPITGGDNDGENFTYEWRIKGETDSFSSDKNPTVSPTEDTEYEVTVTDSNGCIAVATMLVTVNKKIGKISISKIIRDLDQIMDVPFFGSVDPSIFENIEFEIKVNGPDGYEQIVEVKHGETETLDQLAFGEYTVEEINIDNRFLLEDINPTAFELTKDNQWVEVEVVNRVNYANFEFMKVDEEGNSLAGIDFELSKDGVTETVTTVANEKVSFNFLEEGEYVLKETKTIAGFKLPTETWIIQVVRNVTTGQLEVIIPNDSFVTGNLEEGYEIKNEGQGEFPKTGGVGGLSYIIAGLTILISSLGIYIRKEE